MGAFVVVNAEGWIETAAHVLGGLRTIPIHKQEIAAYEAGKLAREKVPALRKNPKWVVDHSVWPGRDRVRLEGIVGNFEIDLAIARLTPFESSWVDGYPSFKNPTEGILPGTSLCRLGFPFHQFTPTYEKGTGFRLPDGVLPVPLFPLEGIMTRNVFAGRTTDRKREIKSSKHHRLGYEVRAVGLYLTRQAGFGGFKAEPRTCPSDSARLCQVAPRMQ